MIFIIFFFEIGCYHASLIAKLGRDGRVAEGAPLLREYGVYSLIEGSNPSLSVLLDMIAKAIMFNDI